MTSNTKNMIIHPADRSTIDLSYLGLMISDRTYPDPPSRFLKHLDSGCVTKR